jgi:peptidyl-prolyl cis-trans isomerase C
VNMRIHALLITFVFALSSLAVHGQDKPKIQSDPVAATVNGEKVFRSEVLRTYFTTLKGRHESLSAAARAKMLSTILSEMIDQRLVYQHLLSSGQAATAQAVDAEIKAIGERLAKEKKTWPKHLKSKGYTQTTFRRQIAWRITWQAFLQKAITDKSLEAYFNKHRPHYDGGEVRASHIVLRDDRMSSEKTLQLSERLRDLRKKIVAGEMKFAEAAKKYSGAPSRLQGGDIGFFPRHGVQGAAFSRAAFELEKGQISEPVVTSFGVHLIQTTDARPGKRTWKQVEGPLGLAMTREQFEEIAKKMRARAKIAYTKVIAQQDK